MTSEFFRFPHTPHLIWLGELLPRDDKVLSLSEVRLVLEQTLSIEEKVDGANFGISFDLDGNLKIQNRGSYLSLPYGGQFAKIDQWTSPRTDMLFDVLGERLILFGEWCFARHSLKYQKLPDWLLGFDIYDRKEKRFFCTKRRDALFEQLDIFSVAHIDSGKFTIPELKALLERTKSAYRDGPIEGFYIRVDDVEWTIARAKLVRPEFTQSIGAHWRHRNIERNSLMSLDERRRARN